MVFFIFLFLFSVITSLWFGFKQEETLKKSQRNPLVIRQILGSSAAILKHPKVFGFTLVSGLVFGMKLTYLSNAQQLFSGIYNINDQFPLIFAGLAAWIGLAFFINARFVMRFGMIKMTQFALYLLFFVSLLFVVLSFIGDGLINFWVMLSIFSISFFCFGILWGNLGSMAMQYLGQVAGLGSTILSSGSLLVSYGVATAIGLSFDMSLTPIAIGYFLCALSGSLILKWSINHQNETSIQPAKA